MYGINDVFDYESDIRNPRKGGIEGMREERKFHPAIVKAAILTNIPPLAYLLYASLQAGTGQGIRGSTIALILLGVVFMVLAYSVKYLRFKEIPILDSFTSSSHFVGPLIFALALTDGFSSGWPYIIAFFMWGMASHAFGAVQDIIPDRAGGLKSVATVLGAKATVWMTLELYLTACLILIAQGGLQIAVGIAGLLYVANVTPYLSVTDHTSASTNRGWKRFIWLNYFVGFIVTLVLLVQAIAQM
jgi:4-hydroxybenzoate polyprenyltransferase